MKACQLALAYMQPSMGAGDAEGQAGSTMSQHLGQCASLFSTSLQALQEILLLAADLCGNYELDNAIIVADDCVKLLKDTAQLATENGLRPSEGTQVGHRDLKILFNLLSISNSKLPSQTAHCVRVGVGN